MLHFMVDRLHVGTSDRQVVHYVRSRVSQVRRHGREFKFERKRLYKYALAAHHENQTQYRLVTGGMS